MKLNLLSFNIQHCKNFITKEIDVDSVVNLIKSCNADIIGLNEVYGSHLGNIAQYEEIANKLGYYFYFGQTFIYNQTPFGNALISKYKLKNPKTIMIPDPLIRDSHWYETRCIIHSSFEDFKLDILITHYGLFESEQVNALNVTLDILKNIKNKVVFMGDLNMEPSNPKIKDLEKILINTITDNILTYPSINPTKKIDYIFVSNDIKYENPKIIEKVVSDHFPHFVCIEI